MGIEIDSLLASLDLKGEADQPDQTLLAETWADPAAFRAALHLYMGQIGRPLKSQADQAIDFYADAVLRHTGSRWPCMIWPDRDVGWRTLTYEALDQKASALAAAWTVAGLRPGQTVALALHPGPDLLIALAAVLRIGALFSVLSPEAPTALASQLKQLKPDHLVFDTTRPLKLPQQWAALALPPARPGAVPVAPPATYAPEAPLAQLFSPLHEPETQPRRVPAQMAFFHALRDGILAFRLAPGRSIAAPGAHPVRNLPALWLSALLCGAVITDVPMAHLKEAPEALLEWPPDVLFISEALRDLMSKGQVGGLHQVTHWMRAVDGALDWPAWQKLLTRHGLTDVPSTQLLMDASLGGCLLTSARRPGSVSARCLPSAGQPWGLFDLIHPERAASGLSGIFRLLKKGKPDPKIPGWFILAQPDSSEGLYGGPLTLRREGRLFPTEAVETLVETLPEVVGACVVPMPGAGTAPTRFDLVIFAGAAKGPVPEEVVAHVCAELGVDARPDTTAVWSLFPHLKGQKVDRSWCEMQHRLGRLQQKAKQPAFVHLTQLRADLLGSE